MERLFARWVASASLEIKRKLADCPARPDLPLHEIVTMAMDFDDALIEIYKEAAREAEDTHAREIFESLVAMEQRRSGASSATPNGFRTFSPFH